MQSASGGEGGRKWRPAGGGDLFRTMSQQTRQPDPRADVLVDIGIVLNKDSEASVDRTITVHRTELRSQPTVMYVVTETRRREKVTVFCARINEDATIEYDAFVEGDWVRVLEAAARVHLALRVRARRARQGAECL